MSNEVHDVGQSSNKQCNVHVRLAGAVLVVAMRTDLVVGADASCRELPEPSCNYCQLNVDILDLSSCSW
jgi:hypothetical protein